MDAFLVEMPGDRGYGPPKVVAAVGTLRCPPYVRCTGSGAHVAALQRRLEWMHKPAHPQYVLWWRASAEVPPFGEGVERLEYLDRHGPSAYAFTFHRGYGPDGSPAAVKARLRQKAP